MMVVALPSLPRPNAMFGIVPFFVVVEFGLFVKMCNRGYTKFMPLLQE